MGRGSVGEGQEEDRDVYDSIPKYPWSSVSIRTKLGSGSFCSVYMVRIGTNPTDDINGSTTHTAGSGTSNSTSAMSSCSLSESIIDKEEDECDRGRVVVGGGNKNTSTMNHNTYYALKKLDSKILTGKESKFMRALQDLELESQILSKLHHPNIIRLHGVAAGNPRRSGFFLLLDLLQKDTLKDYIHKIWNTKNSSKKQQQWWRNIGSRTDPSATIPCPSLNQRIEDIALKIAVAMSYVHSKQIVVRDLKPGNIGFHPETGEPILFDFGFARTIQFLEEYTPCAAGSPAYMAPEIYNIFNINKNHHNQDTDMTTMNIINSSVDYIAADVYSYSILLWELVTLQRPYGRRSNTKRKMKVSWFGNGGSAEGTTTNNNNNIKVTDDNDEISNDFCCSRRRPSLDDMPSEVPSLQRLIKNCWASDPSCRPTFTSIVTSIHAEVLPELDDRNHSSRNGDGSPISVDKRTTRSCADKDATMSTKRLWKNILRTQ